MALSKEMNIDGLNKTLYYKIISITGEGNNRQINIGVFYSKEDAKNMTNLIGYGNFNFTQDSTDINLMRQAYLFLKKLSGFENFVDI